MKVEIVRFKAIDGANMRGFIDVAIDCGGALLQINGIRIVTKKTGGYFYAMPSREVVLPDGSKEYFPICGFFVKGDYVVFHEAVDIAFKNYNPKQAQPKPQEPAPVFHEAVPWESTAQNDFADKNKWGNPDEEIPF